MQNVNIHILEGSGRLTTHKKAVQSNIDRALQEIAEKLKVIDVDIVVKDFPDYTFPETGESGICLNSHIIELRLNPAFKDFTNKTLAKYIKGTLAHELHHAIRFQKMEYGVAAGLGGTLFDQVIIEGLGDSFQTQIYDDSYHPWVDALSQSEIYEITEMFNQEKDKEDYSFDKWFLGVGDLPRWAGFTIGFAAVQDYIKKTGQTAAELVDEPAETFEESVNKVLGLLV